MWRRSESTERPLEIDEASSKKLVYVRRNITEVVVQDEMEGNTRTVYQYEENTVPKADWETYKTVMDNQSATTDLELAVCDLYEMITGGN